MESPKSTCGIFGPLQVLVTRGSELKKDLHGAYLRNVTVVVMQLYHNTTN